MKKISPVLFLLALLFSLNAPAVSAGSFSDIEEVSWAKKEIQYLSGEGVINGYPGNVFKPGEKITRADVAVMLVRELYPEATPESDPPFTDLNNHRYYYDEVAIAYEKNILEGYNNKVRPEDNISRAEASVMVDRAYSIDRNGKRGGISDAKEVSWATESILDLYTQNIINGFPDGTFKPRSDITRAQFAKVLSATINPDFRALDDFQAHFIDVGQGDSILLESPSGKNILIDGGRKSAGEEVVDYLAKKDVGTIDLLVATHPDADHIGGLIDVLKQVNVKKVLDSGKTHTTDTYMEYLSIIDRKDIPFQEAKEGEILNFDDVLDIQVLNAKDGSGDNNESSIVLKVSHGSIDYMLTGDASTEIEQEMIDQYDVEAEILKLGHHGASTSTSRAWAQQVDAEVGILSYGPNHYGHPDETVVNRMRNFGAELYSTCDTGTITVTTDGQSFDVNGSPFDGTDNCRTDGNQNDGSTDTVNVNTADAETLQSIDGVGPSIAGYIIDYRNANGPFQSIEELDNVKYIGAATLNKMKPYITL
ncbi:S-layer protein [Salimicrobium jeotgali]|uniref:S-layer protein n=1 Tax=Salimicrobium jeotgali TaxID=1230341 RepID=K2FHC6_9BACI|nr:S-layer homology domain-containing protein [Salimicrobium jeotgali]AKG05496.1 S-layer protein [Salimicrobium jeotgali]EKE30526.1 putative S-layer protein [Salimicrobium jeotgali]MBM7696677.1 competence ComEA-like helix-hairpin-helix protein [Salimicrobium jeotgali]